MQTCKLITEVFWVKKTKPKSKNLLKSIKNKLSECKYFKIFFVIVFKPSYRPAEEFLCLSKPKCLKCFHCISQVNSCIVLHGALNLLAVHLNIKIMSAKLQPLCSFDFMNCKMTTVSSATMRAEFS